jgi:glycosyltransferase involved in cell wall biosynthesis
MAINVLFIDHESKLGGAEISMVNIVRFMPAENVKYTAIISNYGDLSNSLSQAGANDVFVERMDGWRWWEKGLKKRIKLLLSLPIQIRNTYKWIKKYKKINPDIVHFNLTRLVEPVVAAKILGIPSVMHCREHQVNNVNFFGGLKWHSKLINLCTYWIYNSNDTMKSLEKYKKEKVLSKVIWNGVPVSDFMNSSSRPIKWKRKNKETRIVLMAATLVPWKNHKYAFRVAKKILEKDNNVLFVFAGTGNNEFINSLNQQVEDLGISDNVIFPGFIEDNVALFQSADLLMHTSKHESFGKIYVEAMAAGIPVVALKGGAASEVVKDNFGGFLFEDKQLDDMVNKILELLKNKDLYANQGKLGRERATSLFSMEQQCEKVLNVYNTLIN